MWFYFSRFNDCASDSKECRYLDIVRLILPDVAVFLTSLFCMVCSRPKILPNGLSRSINVSSDQSTSYIGEIVPVFVGLMLLFAGIIQPNVLTSVYFLAFLILGICWGFHLLDYLKKNRSFTIVKLFLTIYAGLHTIVVYVYQFPSLQKAIPPDGFFSRFSTIYFNHG